MKKYNPMRVVFFSVQSIAGENSIIPEIFYNAVLISEKGKNMIK